MNLAPKKDLRLTERFTGETSFHFIHVLNHNQFLDATLNKAGVPAHKLDQPLGSFRRRELCRARWSSEFGQVLIP